MKFAYKKITLEETTMKKVYFHCEITQEKMKMNIDDNRINHLRPVTTCGLNGCLLEHINKEFM